MTTKWIWTLGLSFVLTLGMTSCDNKKEYRDFSHIVKSELNEEGDSEFTQDDAMDILNSAVAEYNSELPSSLGYGMTMTGVELRGSYLYYIVECDEEMYDMDEFAPDKDAIIQNLIDQAADNDDMETFIAMLLSSHKGVVYRYVGDVTGQYVDVKIPYAELNEIFE